MTKDEWLGLIASLGEENTVKIKKWTEVDGEFFIMYTDGSQFINHSDNPNVKDEGNKIIALRDINTHEEITLDYKVALDPRDHEFLKEYLK